MAVKIRLKRIGKTRAPFYRIVVMDARNKRDGRAIEEIGKYNPKTEPSFIHVESDRAQYWLGVGAQPTEAVVAILKASGDWQKFRGEPAPAPLRVAEPKRNKLDIFNEALADAHGDAKTAAVTKKAAKKKADSAEPGEAVTKKADKKTDKKAEKKAEKKVEKKADDKAEVADKKAEVAGEKAAPAEESAETPAAEA